MKILAINWRDPLHPEAGGAEVHLNYILSHLARKYTVVLVSTKTTSNKETFIHNGYEVRRIGHPLFFNFLFYFQWKKYLSKENFDIVIDDISKIGLQTPLYIKNIPIISIFHHIHGATLFKLLPFPMALYVFIMERIALKSYLETPMVVVSESSKKELLELAPFKKISIIHNGIENKYLTLKEPKKISQQFCSIGRLTKAKRVDLSIEVFARILKKYPDARFYIAGKGSEEKNLKQIAKNLNIDHAVYFLGFISEEQKIELLESSEALLFTSEKEGWGITIIEAAACFTPTFGFDVPGIRDAVKSLVNGVLVPFNNLDQLETVLITYIENKNKINLQGSSYCYAKNFNWSKLALEFELFMLTEI